MSLGPTVIYRHLLCMTRLFLSWLRIGLFSPSSKCISKLHKHDLSKLTEC